MAVMTYAEAIRLAIREEMTKDPTLFMLGEDIGIRGGAFAVTTGLYKDFPNRIIDTPISENAIPAIAYGAAITGVKAIAEFMYADFSLLGIDHVINSAAKYRFMYGAQGTVPVVFRLPGGGGRQNGAQHSQCLEAMFSNIPGLKVVMPATPADAKGLLKAAINDYNPIAFIEHKAMYFDKGEVPEDPDYIVPIGKGVIRRAGTDITIVATAMNVTKSLKAAETLEQMGISAEVIDMRTIVPYDKELIFDSVKKTGRILVTHEAPTMYGIGGEIVAAVAKECFSYLDAPPQRVGSKFLPMPYNKTLETHVLPQIEDIVEAAKSAVEY